MGKLNKAMPTLFLAHGSPMNALEKNSYTDVLGNLRDQWPRPTLILVVSAHWLTRGVFVTGMENPKTIHDFHGFPEELYKIRYPAPGSPECASKIMKKLSSQNIPIHIDYSSWGLDHGTWSVLKHLYPEAQIPVLQLSLDLSEGPEFHFNLGRQLQYLRHEGVLILGSGNIVHNLREIRLGSYAISYPWAVEFDSQVRELLLSRKYRDLMYTILDSSIGKMSVPTVEHFYPLLYILGASMESDLISFPYEGIHLGSISMRCIKFE